MTQQQTDMGFEAAEQGEAAKKPKKARMPRMVKRVELRGIEVTQADIDDAVRGNSHSCMIAEAIKRARPDWKNVQVDVQSIRATDTKNDRRLSFITPAKCQNALTRFDLGVMPRPFVFNMASFQVTSTVKTRPKLDAEGKPVMKTVRQAYKRVDGSEGVAVYEKPVQEKVSGPTRRKVLASSVDNDRPERQHIAGGRMPPIQKKSVGYNRRFGLRAFTWKDDEDPAVVAARISQSGVYGDIEELHAAERKYAAAHADEASSKKAD